MLKLFIFIFMISCSAGPIFDTSSSKDEISSTNYNNQNIAKNIQAPKNNEKKVDAEDFGDDDISGITIGNGNKGDGEIQTILVEEADVPIMIIGAYLGSCLAVSSSRIECIISPEFKVDACQIIIGNSPHSPCQQLEHQLSENKLIILLPDQTNEDANLEDNQKTPIAAEEIEAARTAAEEAEAARIAAEEAEAARIAAEEAEAAAAAANLDFAFSQYYWQQGNGPGSEEYWQQGNGPG